MSMLLARCSMIGMSWLPTSSTVAMFARERRMIWRAKARW